jgi:hypothetical protein
MLSAKMGLKLQLLCLVLAAVSAHADYIVSEKWTGPNCGSGQLTSLVIAPEATDGNICRSLPAGGVCGISCTTNWVRPSTRCNCVCVSVICIWVYRNKAIV